MDAFTRNFPYTLVVVPPAPPNLGTSLTVPQGHSARFPAPPFNVTIWPQALPAIIDNAEIVRVTAINNDVWTIQRIQESSQRRTIEVSDQIAQTFTAKALADLKTDVQAAAVAAANAYTEQRIPAWWSSTLWPQALAYMQANFAARNPRVSILQNPANIFPDIDTTDVVSVYNQAQPLGVQNPIGTPTPPDSQRLTIRFRDAGTAQIVGWANRYTSHIQQPLPAVTTPWHTFNCEFSYNSIYGLWTLLYIAESMW